MKKTSSSLKSFIFFGIVGGSGAIVNTFFLYVFASSLGLFYVLASILATEIAVIFNFFGNNIFTFGNHKGKKGYVKFFQFQMISISTITGTVFLLFLLTSLFGRSNLLIWNLFAIGVMSIANYFLNVKYTWRKVDLSEKELALEYQKSKSITYIARPAKTEHISSSHPNPQLSKLKLIQPFRAIGLAVVIILLFLASPLAIASYLNESSLTDNLLLNDNLELELSETDMVEDSIPLIDNNTNLNDTIIIKNLKFESNEYIKNVSNFNELTIFADSPTSLVAVSHLGYHPNSTKQVIVYTNQSQGTFNILQSGISVFNGNLSIPKDAFGNNAVCQGNQLCLVGDFSNFKTPGSYIINVSSGLNAPQVIINKNIYQNNIGVFFEFFNALQQQDSDYHADFHSGYNPPFLATADGSFIMESSQASKTLVRLGSAYRRNPALFEDTQSRAVMKSYTEYLRSLQGLSVTNMSPGDSDYKNGFRLNALVKINNVFYPGPVPENITFMNIYSSPGSISDSNVPVTSLCGEGNVNNNTWKECIDYAASYYKCQIDEPCANGTYMEKTGKITGTYTTTGNYGIATGWSVGEEFGCFFDADLQTGVMNDKINPCFMFLTKENPKETAFALLAFLEALPALYDSDPEYAQQIFDHSMATYNYIKQHDVAYWQSATSDDQGTGALGTAEFLLYDYTGNVSYLNSAHSMRAKVGTVLVSDATHGNEFYWEEYIRHKEDITDAGLAYNYLNRLPEELVYQGTLWQVWKDRLPNSISQSGERVFQFDNVYSGDPNHRVQFQNSRYVLTMGTIASKTQDIYPNAQSFDKIIADNQLAWITGMNSVQKGVSLNSTKRSYSFIFGIGESINPMEFHSRFLINTGFKEATASNSRGQLVGVRGTAKQFFNGSDYIYLDGTANILGSNFGSPGNGYRNETKTILWSDQSFTNGKTVIPGWINGAFDNFNDQDTVWNYDDNRKTYEFTESTNEMVATAVELFAYSDALYNDASPHEQLTFSNETPVEILNGTLSITSNPSSASVYIDGVNRGQTPANISLLLGSHIIVLTLPSYNNYTTSVIVSPISTANVAAILTPTSTNTTVINGTLIINGFPLNASVLINGTNYTNILVTPVNISLNQGNYAINIGKAGYVNFSSSISIIQNQVSSLNYNLTNSSNGQNTTINGTLLVDSLPSRALVLVNGTSFLTPGSISLRTGSYNLILMKDGYQIITDNIIIVSNQTSIRNYTMNAISQNFTNVTVVSSSTSLPFAINSSTGALYTMFETDTAYFNITFSGNTSVNWSIGGILYTTTSSGTNHNISWRPNILTTSNLQDFLITATSGNSVASFTVDVHNTLNPFFSPDRGSDGTRAYVFTNDKKVLFKSLEIQINNKIYSLQNVSVPNNETEWSLSLADSEFICGGNDIEVVRAISVNGLSNYIETLPINARGFEKICQSNQNSGGGGGGGGSNGRSTRDDFSLVYVFLEKEVVSLNENQEITLDIQNTNRILKVEAIFSGPDGKDFTAALNKISGTDYYGTWQANIDGFSTGLYTLKTISASSSTGSENFPIDDRSFYVVSDTVSADEHLMIVYTLLDKSNVDEISDVTLTLDARDTDGIEEGIVSIDKIHGGKTTSFNVPLEFVSGTDYYGTWQVIFEVNQGDTTYKITNITLSNVDNSRVHIIKDRTVYASDALPFPAEDFTSNSLITGNVLGINFSNVARSPFILTIVALIVVALISISFLLQRHLRSRRVIEVK